MPEKCLSFWFNFFCPYSYLGWESLKRSISGADWKIVPTGIDYETGRGSLQFKTFDFSSSRWERISVRAEILQIPIRKPSFSDQADRMLLRGLKAYSGVNREKYINSAFKAVFNSEIDTADMVAFADFLKGEGIADGPFLDGLRDPENWLSVEADLKGWPGESSRLIPRLKFVDEVYAGLIDQRGIENFLSTLPV